MDKEPFFVVSFSDDNNSHNILDAYADNQQPEVEMCPSTPFIEAWITYGMTKSSNFTDADDLEQHPDIGPTNNHTDINPKTMALDVNLIEGWKGYKPPVISNPDVQAYDINLDLKRVGDNQFTEQQTVPFIEPLRIIDMTRFTPSPGSAPDGNYVPESVLEYFLSENPKKFPKKLVLGTLGPSRQTPVIPVEDITNFRTALQQIPKSILDCGSCDSIITYTQYKRYDHTNKDVPEFAEMPFVKNRKPRDSDDIEFYLKNANTSDETSENKQTPVKRSGRNLIVYRLSCARDANIRDKQIKKITILDGNDFFDIAFDRYRCFDTPATNCSVSHILEIVSTALFFILAYITFRAMVYTIEGSTREPCISIIEKVSDAAKDVSKKRN